VGEPVLAEPDQIDFNTLANAQWGVIDGCEVNAQSAKTVAISDGTAIVNGKLVLVTGNSLPLPTPGANGQFVLVVVDDGGVLRLNTSASASVDPVFPDPEANETVLASVYCDATSASFANNIVDKRKLLSKALLTKIPTTGELIRNANNTGNHYLVRGDGKTSWEGDTFAYRSGVKTLKIEDDLQVKGDIASTNLVTSADVTAVGNIAAKNFSRGTVLPNVSSHVNGDIFIQVTNGNMYVCVDGVWSQFASMSATQGIIPIGTVITCLQSPTTMRLLGWYPMDGTESLSEDDHPGIFNVATGGTVTGTAPHRILTLPNLNRRTMIVDFNSPHSMGPTQTTTRSGNLLTLTTTQLPTHNHSVGGAYGRTSTLDATTPTLTIPFSGAHSTHDVSGGYHEHPVYDPGHTHQGMDWFGVAAPIIAQVDFAGSPKEGKNKLDAMFNDSSHTYDVEPIRWTMRATTGIGLGPNYNHGHTITGGEHSHGGTVSTIPAHYHTVSELDVGNSGQIDITPLNFTIYAYIRA
jgi:hypothetical protein